MPFLDDQPFLSRALSRPSCFNQDRPRALLANPGFASKSGMQKNTYPFLWVPFICIFSLHTVQDAVDLVKERDLATPVVTCLYSDLVTILSSTRCSAPAVRKAPGLLNRLN